MGDVRRSVGDVMRSVEECTETMVEAEVEDGGGECSVCAYTWNTQTTIQLYQLKSRMKSRSCRSRCSSISSQK